MAPNRKKTVNIALQGGGAHGAFAWGILDKLLEDDRISVEGFTATSAGTMNALAFTQGITEGGPDHARKRLEQFWQAIANAGSIYSPVRGLPFERMFGLGNGENPAAYFWFDTMTKLFSPYQFNPFDLNPLKDVLEDVIDFDVLRSCECMKLFISATNVQTGKVKIFKTEEISIDVALASACLPFLFKAVEIDGQHYWDGGYMGNPALYPLFYETDSRDIILVNLNPIERDVVPTDASDIMNRINEISFNTSLLKELRAISFVQKLIEQDMLKDDFDRKYKDLLIHPIRADDVMKDYSIASKFDTDWNFLVTLRDLGRETMEVWLDNNFDNIGECSSVDLKKEFLS